MVEITDEQLEELKDAFTLFDKLGDDKVDGKQIISLLRSLGLNPLTADVQKVMRYSSLQNTRVDFPTFVGVYEQFTKRPTIADTADMIEMFKTLDRDGSQNVFGGEMRRILLNLGDTMTPEEIDALIAPHENADLYISYETMLKAVMAG